jgi:hypothetical protein
MVKRLHGISKASYNAFGFFEMGSYCVAQAGLEFVILLQPPKC